MTDPSPSSIEALRSLTSLVRDLFDDDAYTHAAHYAALIAELQDAHDLLAQFPKGSAEWHQAYRAATKVYNVARVYAIKYKFDPPNAVMRECGYAV